MVELLGIAGKFARKINKGGGDSDRKWENAWHGQKNTKCQVSFSSGNGEPTLFVTVLLVLL